jgi:hypothetical protein
MRHPIYKIVAVRCVRPYSIQIRFDNGIEKMIDLEPVLHGVMYGPLRERDLFEKVEIDPEVGTIQWPNGADFDPATLYHWEENLSALLARALEWEAI